MHAALVDSPDRTGRPFRITVLVGVICLAALPLSCNRAAPVANSSTSGPRLRAPQTEFRSKSSEGHVRHEFVIESTGTEPLVIKDVISSCGCTVAHPSRTEIAPGDSATIAVDLRVEPSRRESSVFVRSTDRSTPVLELKVAATDMPNRLVQFVPSIIRLTPQDRSPAEVETVLKVEQWNHSHTQLKFQDFRFNTSDGIRSIEPASFTSSGFKPIVWGELPTRKNPDAITVELLDRTVTLIPVRLRIQSTLSSVPVREFVRVDLVSPEPDASAILAFEVSAP